MALPFLIVMIMILIIANDITGNATHLNSCWGGREGGPGRNAFDLGVLSVFVFLSFPEWSFFFHFIESFLLT